MSEKVKKTGKIAIVFGVILALVGGYVLMPQAKAFGPSGGVSDFIKKSYHF